MPDAWTALGHLISLVFSSVVEVFIIWFAVTGWALPFVLAIGAASMRKLGQEYIIACIVLLSLTALNGYYASLYFDFSNTFNTFGNHTLFFQSLTPFVVYAGGPAIWYSLQAYLDPLFRLRPPDLIHFIPGILASLIMGFYVYSTEADLWPFSFTLHPHRWLLIGFIFSAIYGVISLVRFVKIYQEDDGKDQATRYRHRFLWVTSVVFTVLSVTACLVLVAQAISPIVPLAFSTLVLTFTVAFYCRYPQIFEILMESIQSAPHRRTALPEALVTHLQHSLAKLMEEDKVFLQSDLSMPRLAELADVTPHQLSEYLNFHVGSNFSRFINGYRIEEVKKHLSGSPGRAIIEIAMECGFNSKSTFNTAFSDISGMTPSAWRKNNKRGP
ncbi:MAG: helix-turn-helix domain-containing protein [Ketobacteraceae bacterium]|nr:helix-turn-helix domain-containing protein [Ketobacteraceae bacterium]